MEKSACVHYLPCSIKHDGPALINSYFESSVKTEKGDSFVSNFRGRQLIGQLCSIPKNMIGNIFNYK